MFLDYGKMKMHDTVFIACHECDLIHRIADLQEGNSAVCQRCGYVLFTHKADSLDRSLALTLTGFLLFIITNAYPLLEIEMKGLYQKTNLFGGVKALYSGGDWSIALLVFFTAILFPLSELILKLYILLPIKLKRRPWKMVTVLSFLEAIKPWGMMDVFMLGILVSVVKLVKMATVIPGLSLYAFFALIFIMAAGAASFDTHAIWEKVGDS
jgi:paraquat-inducible protein A